MKGLRNITFPTRAIAIPGGGEFAVRGLTTDMALNLYLRHAGQLSQLFDMAAANAADEDFRDIAMRLLTEAPHIMAELIALATGSRPGDDWIDPDEEANPLGLTEWERDVRAAQGLPIPVQVDALMGLAEMTFTSSMPPKKFFGVVIGMARKMTLFLNSPNIPSEKP
jgi:hypothetical protein